MDNDSQALARRRSSPVRAGVPGRPYYRHPRDDMREKVNDSVSVVMYYSARKRSARPHIISWQNKEYTVKELGYHHAVLDGRVLHHIFELTVNESELWMRLNLDTSNLHWTLEAISDGLAA